MLFPDIPRDIQQVLVNGVWALTLRNQMYLMQQNNNRGMLIFATDEDIRALSRCDEIFLDGTFKTSPFPYTQFYTIHGTFMDHTLMFASGLFTNKDELTYTYSLSEIKQRILPE